MCVKLYHFPGFQVGQNFFPTPGSETVKWNLSSILGNEFISKRKDTPSFNP